MNIPMHLPEKLNIAFPIWLLYGSEEDNLYHDLDKVMREHKERGFNCLRFDDGAGLIHDEEGNPIKPFKMKNAFGWADEYARQMAVREGMRGDLMQRLIDVCISAKKHGMFIILSSWFYLHTYWFVGDKKLNEKLFSLPQSEVFMTFAKFLDYILKELKKRELLDTIAFAEIANEADGWAELLKNEKEGDFTQEEISAFKEGHEKAIEFLKEKYPEVLFAYDSQSPFFNQDLFVPSNIQVFNCHPYYMWGIYDDMEEYFGDGIIRENQIPIEEIIKTNPEAKPDWHHRIWHSVNLDESKIPLIEEWLAKRFDENYDKYIEKLENSIKVFKDVNKKYGGNLLLVCGEGVAYVTSFKLQWEEKSEKYWKMLEYMAKRFNESGFWGSVVRTNCGPKDPSWNMCKNQILRVNKTFSGEI